MYKIFAKLCELHNVTPYRVSKDTGISRSTLSDWKTGKSEPKTDKLELIAKYFNVSVDYLLSGKEVVEAVIDCGLPGMEGTEYYIEVRTDPNQSADSIRRAIEFEKKRWLSPIERVLIAKYNIADNGTQSAVRKLLDISDADIIGDAEKHDMLDRLDRSSDVDEEMPIAAHEQEGATPEDLAEDVKLVKDDEV